MSDAQLRNRVSSRKARYRNDSLQGGELVPHTGYTCPNRTNHIHSKCTMKKMVVWISNCCNVVVGVIDKRSRFILSSNITMAKDVDIRRIRFLTRFFIYILPITLQGIIGNLLGSLLKRSIAALSLFFLGFVCRSISSK